MIKRISELCNNLHEIEQNLSQFVSGADWNNIANHLLNNPYDYMKKGWYDYLLRGYDTPEEVSRVLKRTGKDLIPDLGNEENLIIYRSLSISYEKNIEEELNKIGTGLFWSFKKKGAKPYYATGGKTYLIRGKVKQSVVNWQDTIIDNFLYSEEYEIKLYKGTPVLILGLYSDNRAMVSDLKGKIINA